MDSAMPPSVELVVEMERPDSKIAEGTITPKDEDDHPSSDPSDAALGAILRAGAERLHAERPGPLLVFRFGQAAVETAYRARRAQSQAAGGVAAGFIGFLTLLFTLVRFIMGAAQVEQNELYVTRNLLTLMCVLLPCLLLQFWSGTLQAAPHHSMVNYCCSATAAAANFSVFFNVMNKLYMTDVSSLQEAVDIGMEVSCMSVLVPLALMLLLFLPFWQTAIPLVANTIAMTASPLSARFHVAATILFMGVPLTLWLEHTQRSSFLAQLRISQLEYLQQQAKVVLLTQESDSATFKTINHCAKRHLYNNLQWLDTLETSVVPGIKSESSSQKQKSILALEEILSIMTTDNTMGFDQCKQTIALRQIASGTYVPVPESVNALEWVTKLGREIHNVSIAVDEAVPNFIRIPLFPLETIMENAVHNATTHGKAKGQLCLSLFVEKSDRLVIALENEPGEQHRAALAMQEKHGNNALFQRADSELDLASVGSRQSTFLGRAEMMKAAEATSRDTTLSLVFEPEKVRFMVNTKLIEGSPPAPHTDTFSVLPSSTFLICADDDKAARLAYKGLAKKLQIPPERMAVYGETLDEVTGLVKTILEAAGKLGDLNVVCVLDQNMDRYTRGTVLGTNITRELREAGFKGIILIRSANDDLDSLRQYREAGANGALSKRGKAVDLAAETAKQCHLAWKMQSDN